jgi:hypothetical protein
MWLKLMRAAIPSTAASGLKHTEIYPHTMTPSQKRNFSELRLSKARITGPIHSSPQQPTTK